MDDFDYVIGPSCIIRLRAESATRLEELRRVLPRSGKDMDSPPPWLGKDLVARVSSSLELLIKSRGLARKPFKIEEEYEPSLSHDPDAVRLHLSLSVLHDSGDSDSLEGFFYSDEFESPFVREVTDIVVSLLKPHAPWIEADDCSVEIESIGQG